MGRIRTQGVATGHQLLAKTPSVQVRPCWLKVVLDGAFSRRLVWFHGSLRRQAPRASTTLTTLGRDAPPSFSKTMRPGIILAFPKKKERKDGELRENYNKIKAVMEYTRD